MVGLKDVTNAVITGTTMLAADKMVESGKNWWTRVAGFGVGVAGGDFATAFSHFNTSDEHEFNDAIDLMTEEEKEIMRWFIHHVFPEIGDVVIDPYINWQQNSFRKYAVNRGRRKLNEGEEYQDEKTKEFLVREIVIPIRTASSRPAGLKKVLANLTALDVPIPPPDIEKRLEAYTLDLEARVNKPVSAWDRLFRIR